MKRVASRLWTILALIAPLQGGVGWSETVTATITRLDPRFDRLVPHDAKLEMIADGFTWVEG
ncbi:MAG: hypothetical protein ACT4OL_06225, partial [Nitrospiraceae bacterium]